MRIFTAEYLGLPIPSAAAERSMAARTDDLVSVDGRTDASGS